MENVNVEKCRKFVFKPTVHFRIYNFKLETEFVRIFLGLRVSICRVLARINSKRFIDRVDIAYCYKL